ncbi:MAG: hypothetical protein IPP91_00475 [Betaproteobacteria bacterium]|nr:hypothetical protein [Betaproteobacteria bacterium]
MTLVAGQASAEQISIGFEAAETYVPSTSIHLQPTAGTNKWLVNKPNYDQEVSNAVGAAHSGTQAFRWSNSYFDSVVQAIGSPRLAVPAGEAGSFALLGTTPAPPGSNHYSQEFWFRSVRAVADPGLNVTISADDGLNNRMTFLRIQENAGSLDAFYVGYDAGTATFPSSPVASGLAWGTWYHVRIEIDFHDGPSNDVVRVYLGTTPTLGAGDFRLTASTWEDFYGVGQKVAVNALLFRLSNDPGAGNVPQGLYMDDLTFLSGPIAPSAGTAVPTIGEFGLALLALLIVIGSVPALRRSGLK